MTRRIILPVCLLLLLCALFAAESSAAGLNPGNIVSFGHYPQKSDTAEPIEWMVLEVQNGRALLISRYLLDMKTYYHTTESVFWETSSLRRWLNDDFLHAAFTEEEASAILLTEVNNSDGQGNSEWERSHGGENTQDYLFLLSYHEAFEQYFQEDGDRICTVTNYAVSRGAYSNGDSEAGWWWLRSPGRYQSNVEIVGSNGAVHSIENNRVNGCIRPVLWVDTESAAFTAEQTGLNGNDSSGKTVTDADLSGVWFGFEQNSELSSDFCDFRLLRFDPDSSRLDIVRSYGFYPQSYTGTYRISGDVLLYTVSDEYSDGYEEEIPVAFVNGKLLINWSGRCALTQVEDGYYPDNPEASPYMGENKQLFFSPAEDGTIVIDGCLVENESVEIPATIFGQPVTEIGASAFMSREGLKHVVLPEGIRVIGNQAFGSVEELESISLPGTLLSIKYNAFEYCRSLKEIVIPEGTEFIGSDAFYGCDELKLVMLPGTLKEIEENPFNGSNADQIIFLAEQGSYAETWCMDQNVKYRALNEEELTNLHSDAEGYAAVAKEASPDLHLSGHMDGDEMGSLPGLLYAGTQALEAGADPQAVKDEMRAVAEKSGKLSDYLYACENIAAEGTDEYERLLAMAEDDSRRLSVNTVYGKEIDYELNLSIYESIPVSEKMREALSDDTAQYCFSPFYWEESDFPEVYGAGFDRYTPAKPRPGYACVVLRETRSGYVPVQEGTDSAARYVMEDFLNRLTTNSNGILTGNPQLASFFWVFDFSWPFHGVYGETERVKGYDCCVRISLVDATDHRTVAEFSYTNKLEDTIYDWKNGIAQADFPSSYMVDQEKLDAFAKKVNSYIDSLLR